MNPLSDPSLVQSLMGTGQGYGQQPGGMLTQQPPPPLNIQPFGSNAGRGGGSVYIDPRTGRPMVRGM